MKCLNVNPHHHEKRKMGGGELESIFQIPKGLTHGVLLPSAPEDRTGENGTKLQENRFQLSIRRNFLVVRWFNNETSYVDGWWSPSGSLQDISWRCSSSGSPALSRKADGLDIF